MELAVKQVPPLIRMCLSLEYAKTLSAIPILAIEVAISDWSVDLEQLDRCSTRFGRGYFIGHSNSASQLEIADAHQPATERTPGFLFRGQNVAWNNSSGAEEPLWIIG